MIRSRTARVKGTCGAAARALRAPWTRPAPSQNPAAIRDREQTQASPDQGDHHREAPKIGPLALTADAGKAVVLAYETGLTGPSKHRNGSIGLTKPSWITTILSIRRVLRLRGSGGREWGPRGSGHWS
jgi:hypothetical protein